MTESPAIISCDSCSFTYETGFHFSLPSFSFYRDQRWALLGGNGSGKSTWIRLLMGEQGDSPWRENSLFSRWCSQGEVGFLPQWGTVPRISVAEYIALGCYPSQQRWDGWNVESDAIQEALQHFDLEKYRNRSLHSLSGGEWQRTRCARLWVQPCKVLVMDEPLNHLDISWRPRVLKELLSKQSTALFALHDPNIALRYATHVLALKEGQCLFQGPVADIPVALWSELYGLSVEVLRKTDDHRPYLLFDRG